jgi:hypothetical protein
MQPPGKPGAGLQATSSKQQASSCKAQATSSKLFKAQATSFKHQAAQGASDKLQAPSSKHQASSRKQQALGPDCQYIVSRQLSFECLGARDFIKIKEFLGCLIWKLIWWGERRTALLTVTFSSTVKNTLFLLYPNRSGVPKELEFSILVHKILGVNFFHSCQNFASGFRVTRSFSKPCPFVTLYHNFFKTLPIFQDSGLIVITKRWVSLTPINLFSNK